MRAVNLLPSDAGQRSVLTTLFGGRSPSAPALIGLFGGAVVLLALAIGVTLAGRDEARKRDELERRQTELALLPLPAKSPSPMRAALAENHAPRLAAVTAAMSGRVAWDRILNRLSLVVPEDVWLKSLELKAPAAPEAAASGDSAASSTPTGVTLVGYTYSHKGVARFLSRLALIPDLANVQLVSSSVNELGRRKVVAFTIVADVRTEGQPS
jgi:Fimbrial assembly protein (PilN)